MNRLTTHQSVMGRNRKHDIAYGMGAIWLKKIGKYRYELIENAIDKLGQLENIEDGLGIDLITLFKIFNCEEIVEKNGELFIYHRADYLSVDLRNKCVRDTNFENPFYFKDYGKTWALDKKDLTKEKLL